MIESTSAACTSLTFTCKFIDTDGTDRSDPSFPDSTNQRQMSFIRTTAYASTPMKVKCTDENNLDYTSNEFNVKVESCSSYVTNTDFPANTVISIDKTDPSSKVTLQTTAGTT